MTPVDKEVINILNDLIEACKDTAEGYSTAATTDEVLHSSLSDKLVAYAQERKEFASELETEVLGFGGEPEENGTVTAALHRGWINIKAAMTIERNKTKSGVLAELKRIERANLDNYEEVMTQDLPTGVRDVVERQYTRVQEVYRHISQLYEQIG